LRREGVGGRRVILGDHGDDGIGPGPNHVFLGRRRKKSAATAAYTGILEKGLAMRQNFQEGDGGQIKKECLWDTPKKKSRNSKSDGTRKIGSPQGNGSKLRSNFQKNATKEWMGPKVDIWGVC